MESGLSTNEAALKDSESHAGGRPGSAVAVDHRAAAALQQRANLGGAPARREDPGRRPAGPMQNTLSMLGGGS